MLTPAVLQMILLGLQVAPSIINLAIAEFNSISGGAPLTDQQKAEIDSALDASHAALQGVGAKVG